MLIKLLIKNHLHAQVVFQKEQSLKEIKPSDLYVQTAQRCSKTPWCEFRYGGECTSYFSFEMIIWKKEGNANDDGLFLSWEEYD